MITQLEKLKKLQSLINDCNSIQEVRILFNRYETIFYNDADRQLDFEFSCKEKIRELKEEK